MTGDELRIVVETDATLDGAADAVRLVVPDPDSWTVRPLFQDDTTMYVATGASEHAIGTAEYAREAHTMVQTLLDTGAFTRAEADLPVFAFRREEGVGAFGDQPPPPGSDKQWARKAIGWAAAVARNPPDGGLRFGEGIRIGHPDSGYTNHFALGLAALDRTTDVDLLDDDQDARDPLVELSVPFQARGHGTATASVIVGRGTEQRGIVGVAQEAILVPIRAINSVVRFFDTDVAVAVDHARAVNCHVVSMSLGGKGFVGLYDAIQRAVDSGMIVMAAAGNVWPWVVAPASYDNCLAVAATGLGDQPWPSSARGEEVDVAAPGWGVHRAAFVWETMEEVESGNGNGTSFAVAHLAGVAALWLAFWGHDTIVARYTASRVQAAFAHLVKTVGRRVPSPWEPGLGVGVVDADALLAAPLPDPDDLPDGAGAFGVEQDPVSRLLPLLGDMDRAEVRDALAARFDAQGSELDALLGRFEGELVYHVIQDDAFRASLTDRGAAGAFPGPAAGPAPVPVAASPQFTALLS